MKAIRVHEFGGPEVLKLEEVPEPAVAAGEVLVRVQAAGVNPVETYIRAATYAMRPELPYTPGSDAAGTVETIAGDVTRVSKGDRVYVAGTLMTGSYAELVRCACAHVHPLPREVSFAQGAAIGVPYATAYRALFHKAEARPGERVLVHGASGAVGIAAVQLAVAHGMAVAGTAGSERGRKLVAQHGAELVLDHGTSDYLNLLAEWTDGQGPDVILEMLANVNLQDDLGAVARFGRIVVVGNRGSIEIDPRRSMGKDATIRGMALWNSSAQELSSIHAAIGAGLANGTLSPVIARELPLAEAAAAHVAVLEPGAHGKIVLAP